MFALLCQVGSFSLCLRDTSILSVSGVLFVGYVIFYFVIMLYVLLFLNIYGVYNLEVFSLKMPCPFIVFL